MTVLFWSIFGLALAFFAAPGPINVETVRRGLHGGARSAFAVQLGALLAELLVGIAVLAGVAPVITRPAVQLGLTLISGSLLLWTAWSALRAARAQSESASQPVTTRRSFLLGLGWAATNPFTPLIWLTIIGIVTSAGGGAIDPPTIALLGAGYVLGALSWAVAVVTLIGWSRTLLQPRFWRAWNALSGLAIGGYGVHLLWNNLWRS
jgi:chemosensory pili system protein ChpE